MAAKEAGTTARNSLPKVKDWVLASEAAVIIGCSRQYVHQNLERLDAHLLSNYVVIPRAKAEEFRDLRLLAEARRQESEEEAVPA